MTSSNHEIGINDTMSLDVIISERGIPHNVVTNGSAIIRGSNVLLSENSYMKIQVLGPSVKHLQELETYWCSKLIARGFSFRIRNLLKHTQAFEAELKKLKLFYSPESTSVATKENLEEYLTDLSEEDSSEVNKSSITFILEYKTYKFLFLGDCITDSELLEQLEKYVGREYRFKGIKLPHHGSRYNISWDFINRYTADEYYCCTDNKVFDHPDISVLAAIITHDPEFKKVIFNYSHKKACLLDKEEWKEKYNYQIVIGDGDTILESTFEDE